MTASGAAAAAGDATSTSLSAPPDPARPVEPTRAADAADEREAVDATAHESSGTGPVQVLVPRGGVPGERLASALRSAGYEPVVVPLIAFAPPADPAPLRDGLAALARGEHDWLVLTSERTVDALEAELGSPLPAGFLGGAKVAVVGPSTGRRAEAAGIRVDLVPTWEQSAGGLVAELTALAPRGARAFAPRSAIARPELVDGLIAAGWTVTAPDAYATTTADAVPPEASDVDAVLLTSSSTAQTWARLAPGRARRAVVVSIGPRTSETARAAGLPVHAEAAEPQVLALVAALLTALPPAGRT